MSFLFNGEGSSLLSGLLTEAKEDEPTETDLSDDTDPTEETPSEGDDSTDSTDDTDSDSTDSADTTDSDTTETDSDDTSSSATPEDDNQTQANLEDKTFLLDKFNEALLSFKALEGVYRELSNRDMSDSARQTLNICLAETRSNIARIEETLSSTDIFIKREYKDLLIILNIYLSNLNTLETTLKRFRYNRPDLVKAKKRATP